MPKYDKVFTTIFAAECAVKLPAMGKTYFASRWNIFDLIIVIASLIDLALENVDGLNVLRSIRLMRVFKLAQSWKTMRVLLSIIVSTLGSLANLTAILLIIMFIFAAMGKQLFSRAYSSHDEQLRWNFKDFYHAFLMVFRILCGEWIEPLWDCMRINEGGTKYICMAVFFPTLIMGNFMVLNLFLALLLNSFASDSIQQHQQEREEEEENQNQKLRLGISRLTRIVMRLSRPASNGKEESAKLDNDLNNGETKNDDCRLDSVEVD